MPGIRPDDDAMAEGCRARRVGDDLSVPRCLGQFRIFGQRDPIDYQHPHPGRIMNAASLCIGDLPGCKRGAVFEDELLLRFRPLISERRQAFEFFLINHGEGGSC